MKNPRTLNTDYDKWLRNTRKLTSRTVEEILQNIFTLCDKIAGQCNDDIDVVRGKIFKLCEMMT